MSRQAHNRQTALAARQQFGVARSGATIEVVDESGNLVVRKWSPTRAANKGFHLQQNKQKKEIHFPRFYDRSFRRACSMETGRQRRQLQ